MVRHEAARLDEQQEQDAVDQRQRLVDRSVQRRLPCRRATLARGRALALRHHRLQHLQRHFHTALQVGAYAILVTFGAPQQPVDGRLASCGFIDAAGIECPRLQQREQPRQRVGCQGARQRGVEAVACGGAAHRNQAEERRCDHDPPGRADPARVAREIGPAR